MGFDYVEKEDLVEALIEHIRKKYRMSEELENVIREFFEEWWVWKLLKKVKI